MLDTSLSGTRKMENPLPSVLTQYTQYRITHGFPNNSLYPSSLFHDSWHRYPINASHKDSYEGKTAIWVRPLPTLNVLLNPHRSQYSDPPTKGPSRSLPQDLTMLFPLGHRFPRWKTSRSSIAAKREPMSEAHKRAEQGQNTSTGAEPGR